MAILNCFVSSVFTEHQELLQSASRVQELRRQTIEISNDVQALSHELHSSKLEYLGDIKGMKSSCKEFGERQEIQSSEVQSSVAPEIGLCLFRILQEAVHNASKHSGAGRVEVQLREVSGEIHLVISDSGRGFDSKTAMQVQVLVSRACANAFDW